MQPFISLWMAQQKHHKTIFQTFLLNGLLQKACTYICLNTHKAMRKSPLHTVINNWYSILYSLNILKNKVSFSIANRDTETPKPFCCISVCCCPNHSSRETSGSLCVYSKSPPPLLFKPAWMHLLTCVSFYLRLISSAVWVIFSHNI